MRKLWHTLFGHPNGPHGHKYYYDTDKVIYLYHCSCESCCDLMPEEIY